MTFGRLINRRKWLHVRGAMKHSYLLGLGFAVALAGALDAPACTTFVQSDGGRIYFGRNLDWFWSDGLVLINPAGVSKSADAGPDARPAKWTSKYASVTFNQFGQERPFGGMNEAGLVVENMMLPESEYPEPDDRAELDMLQWIQYQLDTSATVADVLATDAHIRIQRPQQPARIHYLVSDASGATATIEFLNGVRVVHAGRDLPHCALTNSTYAASAAFAKANGKRTTQTLSDADRNSLGRFATAAERTSGFRSSDPIRDVRYAFQTLEEVRQGNATVWQMVYDIPGRRIHFRTLNNPDVRTLDLAALKLASVPVVQFVDIDARPTNGALAFRELSEQEHQGYLTRFYAKESLKQSMGDLTPMIEPTLALIRAQSRQ